MRMDFDYSKDEYVLHFSRSEFDNDPDRCSVLLHLALASLHVKRLALMLEVVQNYIKEME